jgi:hypothetical protein
LLADQLPLSLADIARTNGSDLKVLALSVSQPQQETKRIRLFDNWPPHREGDDLAEFIRRGEMRPPFRPKR